MDYEIIKAVFYILLGIGLKLKKTESQTVFSYVNKFWFVFIIIGLVKLVILLL